MKLFWMKKNMKEEIITIEDEKNMKEEIINIEDNEKVETNNPIRNEVIEQKESVGTIQINGEEKIILHNNSTILTERVKTIPNESMNTNEHNEDELLIVEDILSQKLKRKRESSPLDQKGHLKKTKKNEKHVNVSRNEINDDRNVEKIENQGVFMTPVLMKNKFIHQKRKKIYLNLY